MNYTHQFISLLLSKLEKSLSLISINAKSVRFCVYGIAIIITITGVTVSHDICAKCSIAAPSIAILVQLNATVYVSKHVAK